MSYKITRLIIFIALVACSCSEQAVQKEQVITAPATWYQGGSKVYVEGCLVTVQHDGHMFIVEGKAAKGAIIHHPGCPCLKEKNL